MEPPGGIFAKLRDFRKFTVIFAIQQTQKFRLAAPFLHSFLPVGKKRCQFSLYKKDSFRL